MLLTQFKHTVFLSAACKVNAWGRVVASRAPVSSLVLGSGRSLGRGLQGPAPRLSGCSLVPPSASGSTGGRGAAQQRLLPGLMRPHQAWGATAAAVQRRSVDQQPVQRGRQRAPCR